MTTEQLTEEYLSTFTEHQKHVMTIAIEKLGSSFNIAKSNGFLKWKSNRPTIIQELSIPSTTPPAPKKKKRLVVKKTTIPPTENHILKSISIILNNYSIITPQPFHIPESSSSLSSSSLLSLINHTSGSLYCIFTDTKLLYVGTTSDTKKNFPLAYKSTMKQQSIQNDKLYGMIVPNEDNKQRIKIRDIIKKQLFTA